MTQEEKRIKIAEVCGFKWYKRAGHLWFTDEPEEGWVLVPRGDISDDYHLSFIPNYFNDLNAMHEAEKTLVDTYAYQLHLDNLTNRNEWHATAAQRAHAFGLTLNLWKE